MKHKWLFTCIIISLILVCSVSVNASDYKSEVSVGLKYGPSAGNNLIVSSTSGVNIFDAVTGAVIYTSQPDEKIDIQIGSTGFAAFEKFDASGISRISVQSIGENIVECDGTKYRGYIYAERRNNGELLVINYVGTDDYVSSVLGKEMSYTWPKEALKAQAVCARNFVLTRGSTHKEYGFDVCKTTHCQVYGGISSEHENTRQATEETKGILAKYNDELVGLYFFATSGGETEDVENVWGSKYGYLRSVEDSYENPEKASKYKWTTEFTREEIESRLKSYGAEIGSLENITIDSTTDSGRVTKMTFHGTDDDYTVKLEKCRTVLGLYSQKFTISSDSVSTLATTAGTASAPYYALSSQGVGGIAGFSVINGQNKLETLEINESKANNYVINGGGYGHGVGMSQWGARGMAENGFTYDQILMHYFTDIELE